MYNHHNYLRRVWAVLLALTLVIGCFGGMTFVSAEAGSDVHADSVASTEDTEAAKPARRTGGMLLNAGGVLRAAAQQSGTCGKNTTWSFDPDTGVLTIGGEGATNDYSSATGTPWQSVRKAVTEVVVADTVDAVGNYAFADMTSLTKVTLGNQIVRLGANIFSGCTALEQFRIPANLTAIGEGAFAYCNALTTIEVDETNDVWSTANGCLVCLLDGSLIAGTNDAVIPADGSVERIGKYAFAGRTGLTSAVVPDSVVTIGDYAFDGCTSLTDVTVADEVTFIGSYAFRGCTVLTSIALPEDLVSVGSYAFYGDSRLASATFGSQVSTIGDYAFYGCTSLTTLDIPASVTRIGEYAFASCKAIAELTLRDGLVTIGACAFGNCDALTAVTVPDTVTVVEGSAFSGCDSLETVAMGKKVARIGNYAFYSCKNLKNLTLNEGLTAIGDFAFSGCTQLPSAVIPDTVTTIGGSAFSGCTSLISVSLSEVLVSIGGSAFSGCTSLTTVTVPDSVVSVGGGAFYGCRSLTTAVLGSGISVLGSSYSYYSGVFESCTGLVKVTIKDGVQMIGARTFENCTSLVSVTLPDSVEAVYDRAFQNCTALVRVNLGNGVKSIGAYAFSGDKTLVRLNFGTAVESIGNEAFRYCSGLSTLKLPANLRSIGSYAFGGCTGLTVVSLPDSVQSIGGYAFEYVSALKSFRIGKDATSIGDGVLAGCHSINTFTIAEENSNFAFRGGCLIDLANGTLLYGCSDSNIPADGSVSRIGASAFSGCAGLKTVIIPAGVTEISESAFDGCAGLTALTLPDGLTKIGKAAFRGCAGLTALVMPDTVTSIGTSVFENCKGLRRVVLSDNITVIPQNAFYYCTGLVSVHLPAKLERIGQNTFEGCSALPSVIIPEGVVDIYYYAFSGCTNLKDACFENTVGWSTAGSRTVTGDSKNDAAYLSNNSGYLRRVTVFTYTATFVADGKTVAELEFKNTHKQVEEPEVPAVAGKRGSWAPYTLGYEDVTIVAEYTDVPVGGEHLVSFLADGVVVATRAYYDGDESVTVPEVPAKAGYTGAWENFTLNGEDITVRAVYAPISYAVIFLAEGKVIATATYTVENKDIAYPPVPARTGYTGEWEDVELTTGKVTISAVYTPIVYTVTFIADGVTVGTVTYTVRDRAITEPDVPAKEGYVGSWETYTLTGGDLTVQAIYELEHTHRYTEAITPATCTEAGLKTYICTCGDSYTEIIPALGHDLSHHDAKAVTCTEAGWAAYDTCTRCDYSTYVEIPAPGHAWDDGVVTLAPTYEAEGIRTYTCANCNATRTESIPKLVAQDAAQFVISTVRGKAGDTVKVTVALANNPGIVALRVKIAYDTDVLTLTAYETALEAASFGPLANMPFSVSWADSLNGNVSDDFTLVTLTFRIKDGAAVGKSAITLTYDPEDVFNSDWQDVEFKVTAGGVEVVEYVPGDINGDGKINMKDLVLLQQYLNDWAVTLDDLAADVNRDGRLNMKDVILLQQYLNDWAVELK